MLSTMLLSLGIGFALGASIVSIISSFRAVKYARNAENFAQESLDWTQKNNSKALSLAKVAELETAVTELTDSYHALLTSHKKLRSRIGMREHREKGGNGKASDTGSESYEQLKNRLREEAKQKGYNV